MGFVGFWCATIGRRRIIGPGLHFQPEESASPVGCLLKPIQSPLRSRSLPHASEHIQLC